MKSIYFQFHISIYNIKYLTYGALSREQFLSLALPATAP